MSTQIANDFFNDKHFNLKNNPPIIILDQPKTPENIGAVLRIAGNIGIEELLVIGKEDTYRMSKIKKASSTAFDLVKLSFVSIEFIANLKEKYSLIAIETSKNAESIYDFEFQQNIAFVYGNEAYGVSKQLIDLCSNSLFIPMPGKVKSLNVSHAVSISLFEWLRRNI